MPITATRPWASPAPSVVAERWAATHRSTRQRRLGGLGGSTLTNNSTGGLTVSGLLKNGGTINGTGALTVTGTVAPGDPAIQSVSNMTISGGTYVAQIQGGPGWVSGGAAHNAGVNYDSIQMTGGTALGLISASINLIDTNYTSPNNCDEFFVVVNGANTSTASFITVQFGWRNRQCGGNRSQRRPILL